MALLLANCPRGGLARQWNMVGIHKPPGAVDKLPNGVNGA